MHIRPNRFRPVAVLSLASALALLLALAAAPPVRADHDTIPWATPISVATTGANEQESTLLADGKGHVYVFYTVSNSFANNNVSVTEYLTSGALGLPGVVLTRQVTSDPTSARTVSPIYPASAAIDHAGNLYVAWVKQAGYTGGRGDDVYVSRSTDGGSTWVPSLASAGSGVGSDDAPSITVASTGRLWLAYTQFWNGWWNVSVAYSDTAGASFTGHTNITVPVGRFYGVVTPSVAVDPAGRVYVAYSQQAISGYYNVYLAWSDTGGLWTTAAISSFTQTFAYYASVVAEVGGNVHVAWWDNRFSSYGGTTVWYRRSPDRGATWLPEVLLSSIRGLATNGRVSARLLGQNLVVIYQSFTSTSFALGQAISADDGATWYPGAIHTFERSSSDFGVAMDENGTVWAGMTQSPFGSNDIALSWWNGPPSPPTITGIARGAGSLTLTWSAPPEKDVVAYQVWRSQDGSSYQVVATASAPATSWTDTGLANGTYWYRITADDDFGTSSHPSAAASGTVGLTTAEMIANLEAQLAALQAQLNQQGADIAAIQAQLNAIQANLTNLQTTTNTNYANLQSQINDLQSRINKIESEKATQVQSYLNTLLIVVVIVLLFFTMLQVRRMQWMQAQMPPRTMSPPSAPPSGPTSPPKPPAQPPTMPEDEL